ncbi:MAG: hypothetical protein FD181_1385 [Prolixibacteraceae bacterium]|nr:MAG: hypothetical protein FD181_1385 [Prolixibacteraceae bacterium]
MLHKETVERRTLELLIKLMNDASLKEFVLVGGTALALQLGHRISEDIDLFSTQPFDSFNLGDYLRLNYNFELDFIARNTLKGEIYGVQLDLITHQYPWLQKQHIFENIRLASYIDVAAMKLNAISGNGTRVKDFIDIAFLSSEISLNQMLVAYEKKYNSNPIMPLKGLLYYDDINFKEPIKMTKNDSFNWKAIEKRLKLMHRFPDKIFEK